MDYRESTIAGNEWQRARLVSINNERDQTPSITFQEERVVVLSDGRTLANDCSQITEQFTVGNASTVIPLLNPATNEPLMQTDASGNQVPVTATYQDLYVLLWSTYFHLAAIRDAAPPAPLEP